MNAADSAIAYRNQQIMTAPPEELTLMLYNGAIRFVNESIRAIEKGDLAQAHTSNMKAQNIVREFMVTLDMQYEISKNWSALYEYTEHCLIQGNIKKELSKLEEAKNMLLDMRDTWQQAIKQVRQSSKGKVV